MTEFDPDLFARSWNAHDLDQLMAMSSENCEFWASAGSGPNGTIHKGQAAVRQAYAAIFSAFPDAQWTNSRASVINDDQILTEWCFTATKSDGSQLAVDGLDILTIENGKVLIKNSFRKALTA